MTVAGATRGRRGHGRGRRWQRGQRGQRGQATVELALVLPIVTVLLLGLAQLAVLIGDQIRVVDAARQAARAAAIDDDPAAPARAATDGGLASDRVAVALDRRDGEVIAVVRYRAATTVPLVGAWCPDVILTARTNMRDELHLSGR